jgi:Flp pilus assembly pilin Flp
MSVFLERVATLMRDERGAALVEWGLLVVLIAVVAILSVTLAGNAVSETYSEIASQVVTAGS